MSFRTNSSIENALTFYSLRTLCVVCVRGFCLCESVLGAVLLNISVSRPIYFFYFPNTLPRLLLRRLPLFCLQIAELRILLFSITHFVCSRMNILSNWIESNRIESSTICENVNCFPFCRSVYVSARTRTRTQKRTRQLQWIAATAKYSYIFIFYSCWMVHGIESQIRFCVCVWVSVCVCVGCWCAGVEGNLRLYTSIYQAADMSDATHAHTDSSERYQFYHIFSIHLHTERSCTQRSPCSSPWLVLMYGWMRGACVCVLARTDHAQLIDTHLQCFSKPQNCDTINCNATNNISLLECTNSICVTTIRFR